jgi:hypothetical protein
LSIAGETAGSVDIDGPSVPSNELHLLLPLNPLTHWFAFFANLTQWSPRKMPDQNIHWFFWGPPKMAGEDPKKAIPPGFF